MLSIFVLRLRGISVIARLSKSPQIKHKQSGFTLLELVIGMTVFVVALGLITSALLPKEKQSADLLHMIRATELGKSLITELNAKKFDEFSDLTSFVRCNEIATVPCTGSGNFGSDAGESNRLLFDDVDDFDQLTLAGIDINDYYSGFSAVINVSYDSDFNGIADNVDQSANTGQPLAKRILIRVTTPLNSEIRFVLYRTNY